MRISYFLVLPLLLLPDNELWTTHICTPGNPNPNDAVTMNIRIIPWLSKGWRNERQKDIMGSPIQSLVTLHTSFWHGLYGNSRLSELGKVGKEKTGILLPITRDFTHWNFVYLWVVGFFSWLLLEPQISKFSRLCSRSKVFLSPSSGGAGAQGAFWVDGNEDDDEGQNVII